MRKGDSTENANGGLEIAVAREWEAELATGMGGIAAVEAIAAVWPTRTAQRGLWAFVGRSG